MPRGTVSRGADRLAGEGRHGPAAAVPVPACRASAVFPQAEPGDSGAARTAHEHHHQALTGRNTPGQRAGEANPGAPVPGELSNSVLESCHYDPVPSPRVEWTVAGCIAGWAVARLTAVDRFRLLERAAVPMMSLTPHAAAGAGLAALALRRKGPSVTAAAAAAAMAAVVVPRAIRHRQPHASGPELAVLTVNMLQGGAAAPALVGLVRATGADVLFLQELTDDAKIKLKRAGLNELLPNEMLEIEGYRYRGSGIYARFPLRDGLTIGPSYASQPPAGPQPPPPPPRRARPPAGVPRAACLRPPAPAVAVMVLGRRPAVAR